jgi:pseudouridine kinase
MDIGLDRKPRIAVVGAVNVDITGTPDQPLIAQDSNPGRVSTTFGGVGRNIADNLARLGASVDLITVLGDDSNAAAVRLDCASLGISLEHSLQVANSATSSYLCINDDQGDMYIAVNDMRLIENLTPEFLAARLPVINKSDLLIFEANLSKAAIEFLAGHVTIPILAEPVSTRKASRLSAVLDRLQLIKPNRIEAEILSGVMIRDTADLPRAAAALHARGVRQVCISLGREGVYCSDAETAEKHPILPGRVVNTTGCGDAFVSACAWGVCHKLPLALSVRLGLAASAICLEWPGAISPDMTLENVLSRSGLSLNQIKEKRMKP